ncbi:MAG TPA: hypothetical protein VGY54_23205 [Polyangiaceae bacterium]|nr:hypothetical protein [Polyangiaceae bacterium]
MNAPAEHRYSTFALDVHWTTGRPDPALEAHLEECARCRSYLDGLRALDALPVGLRAAQPTSKALPRWGSWLAVAAALVLAVGSALLLGRGTLGVRDGYVATKSAPAAQVLVRRAGQTSVWDGRAPVRAGDSLALRVDCEGMAQVGVLVRTRDGAWSRVFDGRCPHGEALPFTLVVDAEPGDERVAAVLSRIPLDEEQARRAVQARTRAADVWTVLMVFAKVQETP